MTLNLDFDGLAFEKGNGLVTVVAQHAETGVVLMLAHADREALELTVATGEMHYRSRTRGLWRKGATSGNVQRVVSLASDCDGDAVLARVIPAGPACHVGATSCFGELALDADTFSTLDRVVASRQESTDESNSYTKRLLGDRNLRLKKIGEESAELVTALADTNAEQAVNEACDLIYHVFVALRSVGASVNDVRRVLSNRAR
jgi:phosphoribosyl-AMP cyclohydrolase / phosphoribosyl-ATP pyrophosphohydrolase